MAVPVSFGELYEEDEYELFDGAILLDTDTETPPHLVELSEAVYAGDAVALQTAIDNLSSGNIDEPVEDRDTALHLACLYGHLPCVKLLVKRGASLVARDEDEGIPFHDACAGGFTEVVQFLIDSARESGCLEQILRAADSEGDTTLHHAARGEHLDTVRLLLDAGAPIMEVNVYGKTPADVAEPESEMAMLLMGTAAQTCG